MYFLNLHTQNRCEFFCAIEFYSLLLFSECWIFAMTLYHMIEASVTCINTYYARARRHTCTRSDLAEWTRSGTGPVDRSHHRANRNGSRTVPLRSHREVVGSFRNEWTQWNRSEHGQLERFRNRSGFKPVV